MDKPIQFFCLILFTISLIILGVSAPHDGDLWWQMEYGRRILETGEFRSDHTIYSWTKSSNAMIYCAWIAQVILYFIYDSFGMLGLNILRVLFLLSPMLFLWILLEKNNKKLRVWHWCVGFLVFYISKYAGSMLKPEIFGYFCFTLLVFLYFLAKSEINSRQKVISIYLIAPLVLFWVNAHGTFAMGGVFLFVVLLGELANSLFSKKIAFSDNQWKAVKVIIPFTLLALLINPYGYEWPYQVISSALSGANDTHFKYIRAYESIFRDEISHLNMKEVFIVLGLMAAFLFIDTIKQKRFDFALVAVNVTFLIFANGWGRTSYFSPVLLLFTIVYLASHSPTIIQLGRRKNLQRGLASIFIVCVSLFAVKKSEESLMGDNNGSYLSSGHLNPQASADFYEKHLAGNKFCNGYNGGGYLLWRFSEEYKVMIDPKILPI